MPAYNFQTRFADAVASGEKRQTIRAVGKRRHAQPGERLQLYTGMRTKHCRKLVTPDPVCISVQRVDLSFSSVAEHFTRVDIDDFPVDGEAFAKADGFEDFRAMVEWFSKTHGLPFSGVLVQW